MSIGKEVQTFDGEPLTKREVLIARDAFEKGYRANHADYLNARDITPNLQASWNSKLSRERASAAYPLPKVTRTRVVRDPQGTRYGPASGCSGDLYWSVVNGHLYPVTQDGFTVREWEDDQRRDSYPTANRVAVWADLLANPTEEVDDE